MQTGARSPITERRKEQTRLEVAREAVRLFAANGVAATSGEDVARAVGVSVRTLWRYFPTKESFVQPVLATGIEATAAWLRDWPHDVALMDHLAARGRQMTGEVLAAGIDAEAFTAVLRLMRDEPALRSVWLQAHHEAEAVFGAVLADRAGGSPDSLEIRVQAAAINSALRVAAEQHAWHGLDNPAVAADPSVVYREALLALSHVLPQ
ncbi:TetR/AcrR family transcriptional regulator [Catenulispora rubra]|uniref:TetR/AcrR family transcriptional regulator n=1 Tax=Catenulispora rubra TaxID=280293 RepID=UPI0018928453|nr:TetR/AcrR family transcriptional regulator [Catenulispora rubra]